MRTVDGPRSGKRGKVVASRNRFGQYERELGAGNKEGTPARRRVWGNLAEFSRLWNRITEERREGWRRLAEQEHSRSRLGQFGPLDGQKLFNKLNTVLATCGRAPLLDAVPRGQLGPNPVTAFSVRNEAGETAFKLSVRGEPSEDIMIFGSPPRNPGRAECSLFSFLGLLPAPEGGESDITALYRKKLKEWRQVKDRRYHLALEGSRVFIRVWQQENGWENELGMFQGSALVPAIEGAKGKARERRTGGKSG